MSYFIIGLLPSEIRLNLSSCASVYSEIEILTDKILIRCTPTGLPIRIHLFNVE